MLLASVGLLEDAGTLSIPGFGGRSTPSVFVEGGGGYWVFKAGSHYVVQTGLELEVVQESQACATHPVTLTFIFMLFLFVSVQISFPGDTHCSVHHT